MTEDTKNVESAPEFELSKRIDLNAVIIDTPALLNMVKHCREVEAGAAQGFLMGAMQTGKEGKDAEGKADENLVFNQDTLLVTQTIPKSGKAQMNELLQAME